MEKQPPYQEEETRLKVREKLETILKKGYIERAEFSELTSLMYMFDVPKGDEDRRMV
jgi:hypothetical protein